MRHLLLLLAFISYVGPSGHTQSASAVSGSEGDAELAAVIARELNPQTSGTSPTAASETGGWFAERGIEFTLGYTAEIFGNVHGGLDSQKRAEFLGSARTSMTVNLSRLHFARGQLYISGQSLHGRGINEAGVGAIQNPSNLDEAKFNKLVEAWYSDSYFGGRLVVKIGRQYADADFNVIENGADFVNSSYGKNPTILMPTYPSADMGVSAWVSPADWLSIGGGIYKGSTLEPFEEDIPPASKGAFSLAEVKLQPTSGGFAKNGVCRVGVWRQNRGAYLLGQAGGVPVTNYGVYAAADYWFREADAADEHRGPGVFFQWGWAPADRNELRGYWGAGIAIPGVIGPRPDDSLGLGVTQARLANNAIETIPELYYKWQVTRHFTLQPDLQWVSNPSGTGRSALLGGARVALEF